MEGTKTMRPISRYQVVAETEYNNHFTHIQGSNLLPIYMILKQIGSR